MRLKIAVVVHGRFHAFDLTRALLTLGHEVTLFTNYPKWAVERFGVAPEHVRSFWLHGILSRLAWRARDVGVPYPEAWLHRLFSRWAARQLRREEWDVVRSWSGSSEELLVALANTPTLRILTRGSAHIQVQADLLAGEEERTGVPQERPSAWMIAREQREYDLTDLIVVLSSFAQRSFLEAGVPPAKVVLNPLGVEVNSFRPSARIVETRCRRIRSSQPLRVLYVGSLSFQKGMWDLAQVVHKLHGENFEFRLVGPHPPETAMLRNGLNSTAQLVPKQPQSMLPRQYAWGDVFIFPTIQDGFAAVLTQASAGALPIITTTNCSGPDIVDEGKSGWVVPIRDPGAMIKRLHWCDRHREQLATMVESIYRAFRPRTWLDTAAEFEAIGRANLGRVAT